MLRSPALALTGCYLRDFVLGFDHFGFGFALDSRFVMSSSVGPLARIVLGSSLVRFVSMLVGWFEIGVMMGLLDLYRVQVLARQVRILAEFAKLANQVVWKKSEWWT